MTCSYPICGQAEVVDGCQDGGGSHEDGFPRENVFFNNESSFDLLAHLDVAKDPF